MQLSEFSLEKGVGGRARCRQVQGPQGSGTRAWAWLQPPLSELCSPIHPLRRAPLLSTVGWAKRKAHFHSRLTMLKGLSWLGQCPVMRWPFLFSEPQSPPLYSEDIVPATWLSSVAGRNGVYFFHRCVLSAWHLRGTQSTMVEEVDGWREE